MKSFRGLRHRATYWTFGVCPHLWITILILIVDLLAAAWGWHVAREYEIESDRTRFLTHVEKAKHAIAHRMLDHELILRSAHGLFAASHNVERMEWRAFVTSLRLEENFPGIQGVGFARWMRPDQKKAVETFIRSEGFPEFRIWPEGKREAYSSIIYLEPFITRNLRAFGFDMYSESVRNHAMCLARDSAIPVISGTVRLVQENESDIQKGILMYYPVYRRDSPSSTIEERRANIAGWVYSPFRMNDLMEGILGRHDQGVDLEIYDSDVMDTTTLLFDLDRIPHGIAGASPDDFSMKSSLTVYGREWTIFFTSTPLFLSDSTHKKSSLILLSGLLISFILCAQVIHELRQQAKLKRMVAILEATDDIVGIADKRGRITYLNQSGRKLLGLESQQVTIQEICKPEELDFLRKEALPAVMKSGIWKGEITFRSRDGQEIPTYMVLIAHRGPDGKIDYFSTISHDISMLRQIAAREIALRGQLIQVEKMSALGEMVAGIAHEINNPLMGILGNADMISNATDLSSCREELKTIASETTRCAALVKKLLAFARKSDTSRQLTSPNRILEDALQISSHQLKLDRIEVSFQSGRNLPDICVDATQIRQVCLNIIGNAHHAMRNVLSKRRLTIRTESQSSFVRMIFEDSGPGIPRHILPRIFDPFFTTKEVDQGTGLGLSISYGIVAEHGGRIFAESDPGQGARFIIELPFAGNQPHAAAPANKVEAPKDVPSGARILIVDDERSIRVALARQLRVRGYATSLAASVSEAIELITDEDFDILIVDMRMPGADGTEFHEHVRIHKPEMLDGFILSTGDIMSREPNQFIEKTGVRALEKPYKVEALIEVITEIMMKRKG